MKRNSIAQIETGIRNPSDRTLKAICKEFGINYSWLKEGIGEMESEFKNSILDDLVISYQSYRQTLFDLTFYFHELP